MQRDTCKLWSCDDKPRGSDAQDPFAGRFCCTAHELKYEHIKDDAEDARRAEAEEARQNEPHRPTGP